MRLPLLHSGAPPATPLSMRVTQVAENPGFVADLPETGRKMRHIAPAASLGRPEIDL